MAPRYIGMDVHVQSTTIAVMGPSGRRIDQQRIETELSAFKKVLSGIGGQKVVAMEEGLLSTWLYEMLRHCVSEIVIFQPEKKRRGKNDAKDAWHIADQLRRGNLKPNYKAPQIYAELREAVRCYQRTMRDLTRAKNRLRMLYRARGIAPEGTEIYREKTRDAWICQLPKVYQSHAQILSVQLDALTESTKQSTAWLLPELRKHKAVKRLIAIPGIGEIRAAIIVAQVISPHRFRTRHPFFSYCGLGVVTESSSDWKSRNGQLVHQPNVQTRGLNRNRNPELKCVFKGAAKTIIDLMPNEPLHHHYQALLKQGMRPSMARLTLARKLAAITLAIWKKEKDYDSANVRTHKTV